MQPCCLLAEEWQCGGIIFIELLHTVLEGLDQMGQCSVFMQISANLDASLGSRIFLDGNYSLEFAHATARRGRGMPCHGPSDLKG